MPLKLYRRPGSDIWHYRGTIAGDRLRGSTRTSDRKEAKETLNLIKRKFFKSGPDQWSRNTLTFPKAVAAYLAADKSDRFLAPLVKHWGDTKVEHMKAGAIRQSAIEIYPEANGATRNRQVITPIQAVINHCAELELCPPIRIKRFKFEKKIKKPVTVEWLDAFCAHARPAIGALATFMFATACRISEAKRLEWSDIDFPQRQILIVKTKNKRQRLPHMPQRLLVALANLPRDRRPFYWSESSLRRFWDEDVEKTAQAVPGFDRLTFHSCRHGFATKLLRDGNDPKTVAGLGDWSIGLFMEVYAHAIQDATLTDQLFDTPPLTQRRSASKKNNGLE